MHGPLNLVLVLLAAAVLVVVACRVARLPPLLGYLVVGIAIGPHAFGWVPEREGVSYLAEFGVVFLMFSIGLEFSLPKLFTMRHLVFGLGMAQVVSAIAVSLVASWALDLGWRHGVILGGVFAMSSTAILAKMLAEKLELDSAHGRQIIGILLFQDLAVVPLLIIIPALAGGSDTLGRDLAIAAVKAAIALTFILVLGQRLMRPWFHLVARQKSSELFVLNVLLITLALAWMTDRAGLSLALGAFVAGMLISETEFRYQVEEDIKPFRDVLLGLFFVTIGMRLDLHEVWSHAGWVVTVLLAVVAAKALLIAALSRVYGSEVGTALRTGFSLSGAGEFGLVLLALAEAGGVLDRQIAQISLAVLILSMLLSPFVVERGDRLVRRFASSEWMQRAMTLHNIAIQTMSAESHVIICGYGRSGQNLARFLQTESIPFIALDLDPRRVKDAAAAGESVVFGDAARREVLVAAGLLRARALVVSYADAVSALKILALVRELRPGLPVVVRTLDDVDIDRLREAGAAEVVAEILEGSLMLATHAMMLCGVPLNRVLKHIRDTREARYSLFRGFFQGVSDSQDEAQMVRLHSVRIAQGAAVIGQPLSDLELSLLGVEVTAIRRHNVRSGQPAPETIVAEGDVMVLRGTTEQLEAADMFLLQGSLGRRRGRPSSTGGRDDGDGVKA
jgi:CPA2 family monovalent cation:H+ antiporter-2